MITLTREEAQQVLDALKHLCLHSRAIAGYDGEKVQPPIDMLKAKLSEPPCKTGSSCTNKCERCGEVNSAEIHTCTPEPMIDGYPLYSGLPNNG